MNTRKNRIRVFGNQIRRLQKRIGLLKKVSLRFSWYRLGIFLAGLGLAFAIYWINVKAGYAVLGVGLIIFSIVAYFHRRIERSLKKHEIWLELKKTQLARMQLHWDGIPEPPTQAPSATHPFEVDLDITGKYSLLHLLDISISHNGSQRLREWLLAEHPAPEIIQQRQSLISELKDMTRFRDKLLLNFRLVSPERLQGKDILHWLKRIQPNQVFPKIILAQSFFLILMWILLILNIVQIIEPYWPLAMLGYLSLYFFNSKLIASLHDDSVFIDSELKKSIAIFKYLEKYPYKPYSALAKLCNLFYSPKTCPGAHLKTITRIMLAIAFRGNYMLAVVLNLICPWDYLWAWRLNKEKTKLQQLFPEWLNLAYELEALLSLANFAYLNPDYGFPEILENDLKPGEILFDVQDLGHPLIPHSVKITNSFAMKQIGEVVLITGSNMSGKSTFLRTLGINLCLANIGAPVNAIRLQTRLFRVFTCIKINDSLTNGVSQFYAEVKRLKALLVQLEQQHEYPIFFMIDEIYRGTNNRERLIGSRAFISSLMNQNGLGVVTTHDLELTSLAENLDMFRNFHFREEVKSGKMVFDYKLRTGPCPTTNALKIMEMEGLPVEYFISQ